MNEWKNSIEESKRYKQKATEWNAPLMLKFSPVPELLKNQGMCGFFLDLQYGECHELRYAEESDEQVSDVILTADSNTWKILIKEKKDPTMMIMKGKLKLEKGSMVLLSLQREAARALLETAPVIKELESDIMTDIIELPRELQNHSEKKETRPPLLQTIQELFSGKKRGDVKIERGLQKPREKKIHSGFVSTGRGLNFDSFPMKLFQKAKIFGIWNPAEIDFSADREQWQSLTSEEQQLLIHLSALFMAGEEAVTLDLLPLMMTLAKEGRIEEEIFLTSFLWEEAKHTEFFSRFIKEVLDVRPDFEQYHKPFYQNLFYKKLPEDLSRLEYDSSPLAQLKASGTYNMIVEGTLAETGYEAYYRMLEEHDLLPGLREGITNLKQDESRHIAFGLYLINRLLEENPTLKESFEMHLEELLNDATNVIHEIFEPYEVVPFGLNKEWFLDYAIKQFQHRIQKLHLSSH